jgi:hypothetical protein
MYQLTNPQETLHFVAFLQEALPFVDAWTPTDINSGGCGVFAGLLYNKLKEMGQEPEIIGLFYDDTHKFTEGARKAMKNFLKDGSDVEKAGDDHIVIKLQDLYIDSRGIINTVIEHCDNFFPMNPEQLNLLVEKGEWNPVFDRGCTGFIRERLDYVFGLLEVYQPGKTFRLPKEDEVTYTSHTMKQKENQGICFNNLKELFGKL